MRFRFLEDIATADAAFEAYGKTIEELFENCGLALEESMVETKTVTPVRNWRLEIRNSDLENLLFDFLSELIFLKDRDSLLFSKIKMKISRDSSHGRGLNKYFSLEATLEGEEIDLSAHHLRADVKAVTKHLFKIEKEKDRYKATVVLDI